MMKDVSPDLVTGIYRTFAFDRLQSAIKTTGDVVIPFGPTSYYSLRDNLMPQSPRFNRNGELVLQYKLEGYHGSPKKDITEFQGPTWIAKSKPLAQQYSESLIGEAISNGKVYPVKVNQGKVLKLWQFKDWVDLVERRAPNNTKLKELIVLSQPNERFGNPPSKLFSNTSDVDFQSWMKENRTWDNFKKQTLKNRKDYGKDYSPWSEDGYDLASSFSKEYDQSKSNFASQNDLVEELFKLGYDTLSQMEGGSPTYLVKDPKKIKITE
jgi:hypothetical protein